MEQGTVTTQPLGQSFIIKRPRLTKLLDESGARIILLVAPAGYGKTTLAREWLAAHRQPIAWYRATLASADVGALAPGLAAVFDASCRDGRFPSMERLSALTAVHQRPEVLARALVASRPAWPSRLLVGIDDYQELAASPTAEEFLGAIVSLLPATFIITTRTSPAWFTPRLAVYGEALEFGATDLALTDPEVAQIFVAASLPTPGRSLLSVARGWPAVVGMAARMGRQELPSHALPRRLYEFLANDLLASASSATQSALTTLAISGTTDQGLAEELIGPDADAAFNEAEHKGLLSFEETGRLALHPLLSELLIRNVREQPSDHIKTLTEPIADALLHRRKWDECLALAESLEQPTFVVEALEQAIYDLLASGRAATVQRWVTLARGLELDAPVIDLAEGEVALRSGSYEEALTLGARAASRLPPLFLARAQLLAARAANFGEQRSVAGDWFMAAEASAATAEARADAIWGQFVVQLEEESGTAENVLQIFADASDGSVDHDIRLSQGRCLVGLFQGNVRTALREARATLTLVPRVRDPLVRLSSLNQYAWILGLAGRYREALEASERTLEEADLFGVDFVVSHALVGRARALIGLRRFGAARQVLNRLLGKLAQESDPWLAGNLAMQQARLCISLGDLDRAADHLLLEIDELLSPGTRAEYDAYRALIEAARGRRADARRWIRSALHSSHVEARAVVFAAQSILGLTDATGAFPDAALRPFEAVLESGHRDAVVMACRAHPELARRVVEHGASSRALRGILLGSGDSALARAAGLRIPRTARRTDLLTPRELEVYELMAQARTNREIAQSLFISESTTKVHVRHIFEKLGVRSRVEAVRALHPG